jgi:hypothetical protein
VRVMDDKFVSIEQRKRARAKYAEQVKERPGDLVIRPLTDADVARLEAARQRRRSEPGHVDE